MLLWPRLKCIFFYKEVLAKQTLSRAWIWCHQIYFIKTVANQLSLIKISFLLLKNNKKIKPICFSFDDNNENALYFNLTFFFLKPDHKKKCQKRKCIHLCINLLRFTFICSFKVETDRKHEFGCTNALTDAFSEPVRGLIPFSVHRRS